MVSQSEGTEDRISYNGLNSLKHFFSQRQSNVSLSSGRVLEDTEGRREPPHVEHAAL